MSSYLYSLEDMEMEATKQLSSVQVYENAGPNAAADTSQAAVSAHEGQSSKYCWRAWSEGDTSARAEEGCPPEGWVPDKTLWSQPGQEGILTINNKVPHNCIQQGSQGLFLKHRAAEEPFQLAIQLIFTKTVLLVS